jgi:hypothetical protein
MKWCFIGPEFQNFPARAFPRTPLDCCAFGAQLVPPPPHFVNPGYATDTKVKSSSLYQSTDSFSNSANGPACVQLPPAILSLHLQFFNFLFSCRENKPSLNNQRSKVYNSHMFCIDYDFAVFHFHWNDQHAVKTSHRR